MHELSIAQSILSIATNAIPQREAVIVTGISLEIGELSGIEIRSLEFAFSIIKEGTLLDKAALRITRVNGEAECQDCRTIFAIHSYGNCCPTCNGFQLKILKGREMKVLHLVVEELSHCQLLSI